MTLRTSAAQAGAIIITPAHYWLLGPRFLPRPTTAARHTGAARQGSSHMATSAPSTTLSQRMSQPSGCWPDVCGGPAKRGQHPKQQPACGAHDPSTQAVRSREGGRRMWRLPGCCCKILCAASQCVPVGAPPDPCARPSHAPTLTKRRVYLMRFMARPVGFFFFSCLGTLGHWPRTLPARARDPWTLPANTERSG